LSRGFVHLSSKIPQKAGQEMNYQKSGHIQAGQAREQPVQQ